jgi:hypothetical protein
MRPSPEKDVCIDNIEVPPQMTSASLDDLRVSARGGSCGAARLCREATLAAYGVGGGLGAVAGPDGGSLGGAFGGGGCFEQSGKKIHTPPVRVQVIPHASGTTVGVSLVVIRAAIIAVTIAGRIRRETNFNAVGPGGRRILGRLAIGSAIRFSALLRS